MSNLQPTPITSRQSPRNVPSTIEYKTYETGTTSPEVVYEPDGLRILFCNDMIHYKCSCGTLRQLNNTYFCRHCMALRCRSCILHEVDSQYCQHCLEYIPTIDQKFQMNKCASCYHCPYCQNLLSTSVLSGVQQDDIVQRTCKLYCEFCRWSSDTFVTEGSRILSNLNVEVRDSSRITELINFYKAISQKERSDERKRGAHSRGGHTMELLKKYGIANTLSPKLFESLRARTNFPHKLGGTSSKYNLETKSNDETSIESFKPAVPKTFDEIEGLDKDFYYNKYFNIEDISSIDQRLAQVELQPEKVIDFKPISKTLSVKRSLRCKECERNLCRSEYSPISTNFKIQSSSYYHVPELRLHTDVYPLNLKLNESNIVEFTLQNQTSSEIRVKLDKLNGETQEVEDDYDIVLPPFELIIGPKDNITDYKHIPFNSSSLNDEKQIFFQKKKKDEETVEKEWYFKIGFFIKVMPLKPVDKLEIKFSLSYDVAQNPKESMSESKENDKLGRISHIIYCELGPVK